MSSPDIHKRPGALALCQDLLVLERGDDELLLLSPPRNRPLYIPRGRQAVKDFMRRAADMAGEAEVRRAFPQDAALLDMLLEHGIFLGGPGPDNGEAPGPGPADDRTGRQGMSLYLLLAQSCNLGCVYCLNGRRTYRKDANLKMDRAVALRGVELCLDSLDPGGRLEIVFFGGEPLLNWPLAKEIMLHGRKLLRGGADGKSIHYHLTSNLTMLPPDLIDWAGRCGMTFLCDMDGPPEVHDRCRPFRSGRGSFAHSAGNIEKLRRAGLPVALRATITAMNQDMMPEIARLHKELGGSGSALVPVNPVNSDQDILPRDMLPRADTLAAGLAAIHQSRLWPSGELFPLNVYAGQLSHGGRNVLGCGAPYGNTPVIDVGGDVYPCIYLVGIGRFNLGNVMSGTYPKTEILDWMMRHLHVDHMEECRECPWRYICGGGCPVGKLTIMGHPGAGQGIQDYCRGIRCAVTQKAIELVLWELAENGADMVLRDLPEAARAAMTAMNTC